MFKQLKLVAGQVYRTKIKSFAFWSLLLSPIIMLAIGGLIGSFVAKSDDNSSQRLAIVANPALFQTIETSKRLDVKLSELADTTAAKQKLKAEQIDGYLVKTDDHYTLVTSVKSTVKFDETAIKSLLSQVELTIKATKLNLSAQDIADLQTPVDLSVQTQGAKGKTDGGDSKNSANFVISMCIGVFVFLVLTTYTGIIAQEIANEKSSRIMETLLAATSAKVQYYGKIIGVSLLVVTHLLVYLVLGIAVTVIFGKNPLIKGLTTILSGVDPTYLMITVLLLMVGILSYLVLTAIIASIVNDQSQVQQAIQPIVYLSMIGYIASFISSSVPSNLFFKVLALVPFVSPTLMPSRLAIEYASPTDAIIAIVLQVLALVLVAKFGQAIYAKNVLSYSDEKVFKQLLQNFKK
ncbi:MAG: ABC transporter permease [Streptococcaceae bacterium]|jgi:ABC-2 type transport system permease protein|nr:ABC transporter permease [Streptococcaceae bacterium]